jgi:Tol biopolymer transport system component
VLSGYPNVLISYPILGAIVPAWFSEGTAQFNRPLFGYETWDAHRDMLLRMRALDGKLLTFPEMATFGKTTLGNESSYNQGYALTSYIAGQYGEDKLKEISQNMDNVFSVSIDGAIKKALNLSTDQLFHEWSTKLKDQYSDRIKPVLDDRREGDTAIAQVGYMNLYPQWSPDGKKFVYVSNKTSDYTAELPFLVDVDKHTEELIETKGTVYSRVRFSNDSKHLLYARRGKPSIYGDRFFDVYEYDIATKDERNLTTRARAEGPVYSLDERSIYCVTITDGTSNIARIPREGGKPQAVTHFVNGEQVYNPIISNDGSKLYFDYALRDQRQLAVVDTAGTNFQVLTDRAYDVRSPQLLENGALLVSSNRTGIFDLYSFDLGSHKFSQQTNVVGGAFMPSVFERHDSLDLLFADYTSDGYKIHRVITAKNFNDTTFQKNEYTPMGRDEFGTQRPPYAVNGEAERHDTTSASWKGYRNYDDDNALKLTSHSYSNVYNGISLVPVLRYDNYNPNGKGLDNFWAGLYAFSSDVTERLSLSAGAVINHNFERDLFAGISSQSRLLGAFGLYPRLDLSIANSTRKPGTLQEVFGADTVSTPYSIGFLTFDGGMTFPLFASDHFLKLGYTYSIYTSRTEQIDHLPSNNITVGSSSDDYFKGGDLSFTYWTNQIHSTRTELVNPIGWYVRVKLDIENNKLLRGRHIQDGLPVADYQNYSFLRFDAEFDRAWNVFSRYDGFGLHARVAALTGTDFPVDSFFNFYGGGIAGLRGYPYYSLSGTHLASLQARYVFPISNSLDTRILQLYLDKLYFGIFTDAAVVFALDGSTSLADKFKDQVRHQLRRDIGAELRLEAFSWYSVPTAIFFSAAYGLDKFVFQARRSDGTFANIEYGHEMRYYAGVLFTFSFSQPVQPLEATYLGSAMTKLR